MTESEANLTQQLTEAVSVFQKQSTGHTPKAVTVALSADTLVVTLHETLTPAEKILAMTAGGAAQVQEFHRQLFATSSESLRQEIKRITGRRIRDATAEVEQSSGAIIHAFTTGTMVQVFLLAPNSTAPIDAGESPRHEPELEEVLSCWS